MEYVISFIVVGVVFALIDAVWLKSTKAFYSKEFGSMLLPKPKMIPAVIFYLIYIFGLTVFVLTPALNLNSLQHAVVMGALYGVVAYSTYDLTNLATLKGWSSKVTVVDIIWGGFVTALSTVVAFLIVDGLL